MKQLFATGEGQILIKELADATLLGAGVITKTRFSAISVGTEGTTLRQRRAKSNPAMREFAPGYSNAGLVVETSALLEEAKPGDMVACVGVGYASHAQQCYIPRNLLARCPAHVDPRDAAFGALGAVAIQGLRRGRIGIGETVAVIGLGMVGQLAVQIAKAAGTHVLAVDTNEARLKLAAQLGADVIVNAQADNLGEVAKEFTHKRGVDVAMTTSGDPSSSSSLICALELVRHRGRVVVVGNVKCEFPRELWYQKDAELFITTSYGPGRYDPQYEKEGHDYPVGYVRWTEGRNLMEFIRLLGAGSVKLAPLITHEIPFERAGQMYELILSRPQECLGVVLRYDV